VLKFPSVNKKRHRLVNDTHRMAARRASSRAAALIARCQVLCVERETLRKQQKDLLTVYSRALAQHSRDVHMMFLMTSTSPSERFVI
jgi:hypothetical protein